MRQKNMNKESRVGASNFRTKAMAEEEVKLYGMKLSPFALRVEWALKLKGINYDYVHEDLHEKSPQLLSYNPIYKMIPVLVHHGNPISESSVILEYIEETWKEIHPNLLPSDPYQKAIARFWAKFSEEKCLHGSFDVLQTVEIQQLEAVKELQERLKLLEGYLQGKKFFGGETIGLVDIVAGWIPNWIRIIEEIIGIKIIDEEKLPLISSWINNFLALELVKESMPPRDKLTSHMRSIRENIISKLSS